MAGKAGRAPEPEVQHRILRDESGQTTLEWMVLSVLIVMSLIVIGLAMGKGVVEIFTALADKVKDLLGGLSI
jgi:Flp pilus assembly pilin Flp